MSARKGNDIIIDSPQSADNKGMEVLWLVASSGAAPASRLELLCWSICNVCRLSRSWSVKVVNPELDRFNCFGKHLFPDIEGPSPPSRPGKSCFSKELSTTAPFIGSTTLTGDSGDSSPTAGADRKSARAIPRYRKIERLLYLSGRPLSADMHWPHTLRALSFGWMFDRPLESSFLPHTLLELDLGGGFNHQVDHITWPPELLKLRVGDLFNRPIELATLPTGLQSLVFGDGFNQPIEKMVWPPGLKHLVFGNAFDEPIERTKWAATTLRTLEFGRAFSKPVRDVLWPSTLKELSFGDVFSDLGDPQQLPLGLQRLRISNLVEMDEADVRLQLPEGCILEIFRAQLYL